MKSIRLVSVFMFFLRKCILFILIDTNFFYLIGFKMNKIIHDPSVAGQSLADRVMAAKHTITRDVLAKAVYKATTDEIMGPKRKHLDCQYQELEL